MIHKPSAYFQGSFTSDDLRKMLKEMTTFELVFFDKISKRMGRSIIDLLKLMQSRDLFLNGKEAIKMNLADELIDLKCSKELEQDRYQDILVNRTGKIYKVIMSKCPAIRLPVAISVF
jgi:ATP-dependent protease ClpP protease subunit